MNKHILKIYFPNQYGDVDDIFILIICFLHYSLKSVNKHPSFPTYLQDPRIYPEVAH